MTPEAIAKQFLEGIQSEANSGDHYAPCFRDCLADNMDWVQERLAQLIQNIRGDLMPVYGSKPVDE